MGWATGGLGPAVKPGRGLAAVVVVVVVPQRHVVHRKAVDCFGVVLADLWDSLVDGLLDPVLGRDGLAVHVDVLKLLVNIVELLINVQAAATVVCRCGVWL